MRRILLPIPALLLLLFVPAARSTMVTGYATGTIDSPISFGDAPGLYPFVAGERVDLAFGYDLDILDFRGNPWLSLVITTPGGFLDTFGSPEPGDGSNIVSLDGGELAGITAADVHGSIYLSFDGDRVDANYGREFGTGGAGHGFHANLVRVDALPPLPAPEPSTLAMGLVGAALAGVGWVRRRGS